MIQAVLFDMDGTVLDSEPLYHACWERAMDEMHLDLDRDAFFLDVSGMNIPTMRAHCLKTYGADFPFEEVRELRRMYLMQALESAPPPLKPGVPQIFATLRKMGIRAALATSSSCEYATNLMKRHGIDGCFDAIIGGDCVKNGKPHPEIFLRAAELLGVQPEQCVVAEDSRNGVLAGHAAGMYTVMIPDLLPCSEDLRPLLRHCIDTLWELPALIEAENRKS